MPPHSSYDYVLFFPNQLLFPTLFGLKLYIWLFHIWRQRIRQCLLRLKCSCPHRIFVMISEHLLSSTFSSVPTAKHILLFKKKYKNLEEPLSKPPVILTRKELKVRKCIMPWKTVIKRICHTYLYIYSPKCGSCYKLCGVLLFQPFMILFTWCRIFAGSSKSQAGIDINLDYQPSLSSIW